MPAERQLVYLGRFSHNYGSTNQYAFYLQSIRDRIAGTLDPNYWKLSDLVWWAGATADQYGVAFIIRELDGATNPTGREWVVFSPAARIPDTQAPPNINEIFYDDVTTTQAKFERTDTTTWTANSTNGALTLHFCPTSGLGRSSWNGAATGADPAPNVTVYDNLATPTKTAKLISVTDLGGSNRNWVLSQLSGHKFKSTDTLYVDAGTYLSAIEQQYNRPYNFGLDDYVAMTGGGLIATGESPRTPAAQFTRFFPEGGNDCKGVVNRELYSSLNGIMWVVFDPIDHFICWYQSSGLSPYIYQMIIQGDILDPQAATDTNVHATYWVRYNPPMPGFNHSGIPNLTERCLGLQENGGKDAWTFDHVTAFVSTNSPRRTDRKYPHAVPVVRNSSYVKGYAKSSVMRDMGPWSKNYMGLITGPNGPFIKTHQYMCTPWVTDKAVIPPFRWDTIYPWSTTY